MLALAYAASHLEAAPDRLLRRFWKVARTGTHLFQFAGYVEQFHGWGITLRRAVGDWYTSKDALIALPTSWSNIANVEAGPAGRLQPPSDAAENSSP